MSLLSLLGVIQLKIEFADIFDESTDNGKIDVVRFFGLRDSYFEIVRNAQRAGRMSPSEIVETCAREPLIEDSDAKSYAAAMAKFYLHQFGILDCQMPKWIDDTPACRYMTPFLVNAAHLRNAVCSCPPEFLEKNVLVAEKDFQIV